MQKDLSQCQIQMKLNSNIDQVLTPKINPFGKPYVKVLH